MSKDVKITTVPPEIYSEEEYKHPSKYYIVDCMGNNVYIHTRDRAVAQQTCDNIYGKGKYKVRTTSDSKGSGNITVKASMNSKSRSGQYKKQIERNQFRD